MATRTPGKRPAPPQKKIIRPPPSAKGKAPLPSPQPRLSRTEPPAELLAQIDLIRKSHDPSLPHQRKREWSGWLRRVARLLVVNDNMARSVVWWHRTYFSDLVTQEVFSQWATKDGWLTERASVIDKFAADLERQIGTENVRMFVEDLKKLDAIHADLTHKLSGQGNTVTTVYLDAEGKEQKRTVEVVPLTFEKRSEALAALVAVDRRRDEKRKGVLGGLPQALGTSSAQQGPTIAPTIVLTPHVARAMARAKLIAEREELEGTMATAPDPEDDDEGEGE